ncbi:MAG: hypothetical protein LBK70_01610 [Clostridiales bacterium]|jgi:hypothetical protein|nr:hypothetical protein [Clostridiales bacterium]
MKVNFEKLSPLDMFLSDLNDELANDGLRFINSSDIRSGEYETNTCIIKKLDKEFFIVFEAYIDDNDRITDTGFSFTATRSTLQRAILAFAKKEGYEIDDSVIDKSLFDIGK